MFLVVVVGHFGLAACGDNVQCPPTAPLMTDAGAPDSRYVAPCTDIVIWQGADDCLTAGGVYEKKVWPINGGTEQFVCDFCNAGGGG